MNTNETIGILGGMGPAASSTLYGKIIEYAQYEYGAIQDNEYPPVLLNSLTLSGFDETGIVEPELVRRQLVEGVQGLQRGGADFIIIACNTVHTFFTDIQRAVDIPILNLIEECRKDVQRFGFTRVGLFSSESTNQLGVYQREFERAGIEIVSAEAAQQRVLNDVIRNVMGGRQGLADVLKLKEVQHDFVSRGAQGIVLGCTELPLAFNQSHTDVRLFDTLEIIVKTAVDRSLRSTGGEFVRK